ncbi:MAG: ArsB/NhaD family transporter [Peptococcaceae bacterium]|nr:ArsB/NhaD family transporter [Peptococcaceae bacterium]
MAKILPLLILGATIAFVVARPGKSGASYGAVAGGLAVLLLGLVSPAQAYVVWRENFGVLLLLAGLLMLAAAAGKAGFFEWCALLTVRAARQNGYRLFFATVILSAVTTVFFSLDTTAVILTPVIYTTAVKLRLDPVPFLYACIFITNTASLVLPVSNLTNLLLTGQLGVPFGPYLLHLALPGTAAVGVSAWLLFTFFRHRLRPAFEAGPLTGFRPDQGRFFHVTRIIVWLTLGAFLALTLARLPLYPAALAAAAAAWAAGIRYGRLRLGQLLPNVPWSLFFFVFGLEMVVQGVENTGLAAALGGLMALALRHSLLTGLLTVVFGTAAASNLINNLPAAMLAISALKSAPGLPPGLAWALYAAVLVGTNLGPNLTLSGSLATMLWFLVVRRQGHELAAGEFFRVGIRITPVVLLFTTLVLALNILLLGAR